MTLVRAPVGFGKTTLLQQWLAGRDELIGPAAYVDVLPGAGDAVSFWAVVIEALVDAGLPRPSSLADQAPQTIAARMIGMLRRPLTLVLDSFDNVTGADIDVVLLNLAGRQPRLRLLVALRHQGRFALERSDNVTVDLIGPQDLLFTRPETAAVLTASGLELTADQVAAIHAETGGWPEPTRTLAATLRRRPAGTDAAAVASSVAGAVAGEFLQRRLLPTDTNSDLLHLALLTSLPETFSAELAEYLADDPSAKSYLDWLAGEGMLLVESGEGDPAYRWPGAARRALAAELQRRHPDQLPALHAQLARWYSGKESPASALHHALQAEQWPAAVEIIDAAWRPLLFAHREVLYQALTTIPLDAIATSPRALAVRDLYLPGLDDGLLALAQLPADDIDLANLARGDEARDLLDTGLAMLAALRRRGRFDQARTYADRLLELAETARSAQPERVIDLIPGVQITAAQTRLLAEDVVGAVEPLRRAYDWAGDASLDYVAPDAAASLALVHALVGRDDQAGAWLHRFTIAPTPRQWFDLGVRSKAAATQLLLAVDRLDLDRRPAAAALALLPDRPAENEWWAFLLYAHARYGLYAGTALDELDRLDRVRSVHARWLGPGATARALLAAAEADLLLALGRGNQAHAVLHGREARHPMLRVGQARLTLLAGDPAGALRAATDSDWHRVATSRQRTEMLLVHAVAAHRTGDRSAAARALRQTIDALHAVGACHALTTVARADLLELVTDVPELRELLRQPPLDRARDAFPATVALVRLTERERLVLEKLAEELTVQQIAATLVVSYSTVRKQQNSLYRKLGVESRSEAVARARQWGLLTPSAAPEKKLGVV